MFSYRANTCTPLFFLFLHLFFTKSICICEFGGLHAVHPWLRYVTWAPLNFGRKKARSMSCYAFLRGWLLPSLPVDCYRKITSFNTRLQFRNLSLRSGLFPSWVATLARPLCLCLGGFALFVVSLGSVKLWATLTHGELYPGIPRTEGLVFVLGEKIPRFYNTLYLNKFRWIPAISEFDWLFQYSYNFRRKLDYTFTSLFPLDLILRSRVFYTFYLFSSFFLERGYRTQKNSELVFCKKNLCFLCF